MSKDNGLLLSAQVLLRTCRKEQITRCAVVSSLGDGELLDRMTRQLCDAICATGQKAVVRTEKENAEAAEGETLVLMPALRPHCRVEALNSCADCQAVILLEKYGVSRHKDVDALVSFLGVNQLPVLGVIGIR